MAVFWYSFSQRRAENKPPFGFGINIVYKKYLVDLSDKFNHIIGDG